MEIMEYKIINNEKYLEEVYKLEIDSYPEDEAATKEKLLFRIQNTPNTFLALFKENEIIGFINGTKTNKEYLDHESMSTHDKNGGFFLSFKIS
jgi:hypothetical protein